LDQARECLRGRLSRRGLALPAALLATGLAQAADVPVPASLTGAAVRVAVRGTGEAPPAGGVAALAAGVAGVAGAARLKLVAAVLWLGWRVPSGAVALAQQAAPGEAPRGGGRVQPNKPLVAPAPAAPQKPGQAAPKGVRASGRVLGPDGKPLAGAEVALVG